MNSSLAHSVHYKAKGSPWIRCPYPRSAPKLRLVCFPHAGGTAAAYHKWGTMTSLDIEVWSIELPGHGSRFGEAPEHDLDRVADTVGRELIRAGLENLPFALFGHSMGAMLAFEVARRFRNSPRIRHLFASGSRAPHLDYTEPPIHGLQTDEFLAAMVKRYAGIPKEVLQEKDLLELILPALRADMMMIENHRHRIAPPLSLPISVLIGKDDLQATQKSVGAWQSHTSGAFELLHFSGGHFYLQECANEIIALVESRLSDGSKTRP